MSRRVEWRLRRMVGEGARSRGLWWACVLSTVVLACVFAHISRELADERTRRQQLLAKALERDAEPAVGESARDFTDRLRAPPAVHVVVAELRDSAQRAGLDLLDLAVVERPASREHLGVSEVTFTVLGDYAGAKSLLKSTLERFDRHATVRGLRIRRTGIAGDAVEAQATLAIWHAALVAGS